MFDTEKFIYLIEKLPPLYDVKSSDYGNRQLKAKCWSEVGEAMYETWHEMTPTQKDNKGKELMKKWKTLRDNFVRDFRLIKKNETGVPANKKKKYVYFDQLSFLLPHIKGCEYTVYNIDPPDEQASVPDEHPTTTETENESTQPLPDVPGTSSGPRKERERHQDRVRKRKRPVGTALASATSSITSIMQESIQLQKAGLERQEPDKFGNKAFMLSFVPTMDNLPQLLAFDVRMQITEVFRNALENASYTYLPYQQQQGPRQNSVASTPSTWVSLGQPQSGHDRESPLPGYNNEDEDDEDNSS